MQKKIGYKKISLRLTRGKVSPLEMARFEKNKVKRKINLLEKANFKLTK